MSDVVSEILKALERKGLTAAAASVRASGNPKVIANILNARASKQPPRFNYHQLEKIAEVLDLELYFGPRRESEATRQGFGEGTDSNPPSASDLQWISPDAPLGLDQVGGPSIQFSQSWLDKTLSVKGRLTMTEAELPQIGPFPGGTGTVLLDTAPDVSDPGLWAIRTHGTVRLARLRWLSALTAAVADIDSLKSIETLRISEDFTPLGIVLWVGVPVQTSPQPPT